MDELNGQEIGGKTLYVGRAQKKAERQAELKKKFAALHDDALNTLIPAKEEVRTFG